MAYFTDQYGRMVYQPDPPPMDRLQQLQAQRQMSQFTPPAQPPQANQGLLWVQGETGAKSYLMAPNTTVLLMDSEGSRFYLKSTDNAGMPSLRTFEYTEIVQSAPQAPQTAPEDLDSKYVTRQEYDALQAKYAEIMDKLDSFRAVPDTGGAAKGAATKNGNTRGKGGNADE